MIIVLVHITVDLEGAPTRVVIPSQLYHAVGIRVVWHVVVVVVVVVVGVIVGVSIGSDFVVVHQWLCWCSIVGTGHCRGVRSIVVMVHQCVLVLLGLLLLLVLLLLLMVVAVVSTFT